jgi:hypothetical protein
VSGSAAPDATSEAAVRRVEVEDAKGHGARVAETVSRSTRSREERAGACVPRAVIGVELDLALQHVERVHVVVVGVGVNALELRQERQLEHGELLEVGLDQERAGVVLDAFALAGAAEHPVVAAAVGRRLELVEGVAPAADVVAETHRGRMEVEEDRGRVTSVPKRVDDVGRSGRKRSRQPGDRFQVGPELELDFAFQNVERIRVLPVDVRVGSFLAGLVAEPRDDYLLQLSENPQRPFRAIGDGLALTGR